MKKSNKPQASIFKSRTVTNARERETMMATLIRNESAFQRCHEILKADEHFSEIDKPLAVVWQVVLDYHRKYNALPTRELLFNELSRALEADPQALTSSEQDTVNVFVDTAFDSDPDVWGEDLRTSATYAQWAMEAVSRHLEERVVTGMQQTVKTKGQIIEDIPRFLDLKRTELERARSLARPKTKAGWWRKDWDKTGGLNLFTTGAAFLDDFLGGGHAPNEIYGLLGPFGSCKTTLGVMLAVEGISSSARRRAMDPDYEGYTFFISYEAPIVDELHFRTLSYVAQINKNSLENMGANGVNALSTRHNLKEYEKALFKSAIDTGEKVWGEKGRAKLAIPDLDKWLVPVDFTGQDESRRGQGGGYIEEIASVIEQELHLRGPKARCHMVVIDYAAAMCRRHVADNRLSNDELYHLITGAPLAARNKISAHFHCPTWMIHQLSGQANKKAPGSVYDHTDAAGSQSFAENLDFCFVVGQPTLDGLCSLTNSKHRRVKGKPPVVVRILGDISRVVDTKGKYVIDPQTRTIKEADLVNTVQSGETLSSNYSVEVDGDS